MNRLQRFLSKDLLGLDAKGIGSILSQRTKAGKTLPGKSNPLLYQYALVNGAVSLYDVEQHRLIENGYMANPDLFAVTNFIMRKAIRAGFYLYTVKDEKALNSYKMLTGEGATKDSLIEAKRMRTKALQELEGDHPIKQRIENPNPFQSGTSFREEAIGYELLTGKRFIRRVSGAVDPVVEMYVMPSTLMEVKAGKAFRSIDGYVYLPGNQTLTAEEIIYSHNFRPAIEGYGAELDGLSPLQILARSIQQGNEGRISSIRQFQNAGPPGIVTIEDPNNSLESEQIEQIKEKVYLDAGGSENRGRAGFINFKASYTQIGLSPVDLDILKSVDATLKDYCNVYGLDHRLFGADATFNNRNEAKKAAITDAIVPRLMSLRDDYNAVFAPYSVKGKKFFIDCDVTDFPEMQEDMNALVDRLEKAWWISPNQKCAAMQYEEYPDPLFNEPWIKAGYTPLSEFKVAAEQSAQQQQQPPNDGSYN